MRTVLLLLMMGTAGGALAATSTPTLTGFPTPDYLLTLAADSRTPTSTPTRTPTPYLSTTFSFTPTLSYTQTKTPQLSASPTPSSVATPLPWSTPVPWVETPVPAATPAQGAAPSGAMLADFENPAPLYGRMFAGDGWAVAGNRGDVACSGAVTALGHSFCAGYRGQCLRLYGTTESVLDVYLGGTVGAVTPANIIGLSPDRCLTFALRGGRAGQSVTVRLAGPGGNGFEATVVVPDSAWAEFNIGFPGSISGAVFTGFGGLTEADWGSFATAVTAVEFIPQTDTSGIVDLALDEIRFAPATRANTIYEKAAAMGADPSAAAALADADIDPLLELILLRLTVHCGCSPAQLLIERKSLSWGGVAEAHGVSWADLVDEVLARRTDAGLAVEGGDYNQTLRSSANNPDGLTFSTPDPAPNGPVILQKPTRGCE